MSVSSCARHPQVESTFTCERCGDFCCYQCEADQPAQHCVDCAQAWRLSTTVSPWSIAGAILGFFGVGCAPFGWLGVFFVLIGFVRQSPEQRARGALFSAIGLALGALGTALWFFALYQAATGALPVEPAYLPPP